MRQRNSDVSRVNERGESVIRVPDRVQIVETPHERTDQRVENDIEILDLDGPRLQVPDHEWGWSWTG